MNFPDILLVSSDRAANVFAAARAAEAAIPAPTEADVERVLSTLPDKAAAGALVHPDVSAGYFLLAEWEPSDRAAVALYEAVAHTLSARGLRVTLDHRDHFGGPPSATPTRLLVSRDSIHEAAARIRWARTTWIEEARRLWITRCGEGATVEPREDHNGASVLFSVPADTYVATPVEERRFTSRQNPQYSFGADAMDRDPAEAVVTAASSLRIVRWTVSALSSRWAEITGGDIVKGHGKWSGNDVRSVPTLIFRVDSNEHTEAVEDIFDLSIDAILDRAAQAIGLGTLGETTRAPEQAPTETSAGTEALLDDHQGPIEGGSTKPPDAGAEDAATTGSTGATQGHGRGTGTGQRGPRKMGGQPGAQGPR